LDERKAHLLVSTRYNSI